MKFRCLFFGQLFGCAIRRLVAWVIPMSEPEDRIERSIQINAPVSRVWRALTDHREFGEWFRVKLDGPFVEGRESTGHITYPGYEHLKWHAVVKEIRPESLFSFTWHPYAIDPEVDYSEETPTLVTFQLEEVPEGCRLSVTESGFDKIPPHRRWDAFESNSGGWTIQMDNIANHVRENP